MVERIFSISAGHQGSLYLSVIFEHAARKDTGIACSAYHELLPIMHHEPMHEFNNGNEKPLRDLMPLKLQAIAKHTKPGSVYVETNHCFIKGFGYLLSEHFPEESIGVVYLRRDIKRSAWSNLRNRSIPGNVWGNNWGLDHRNSKNLLKIQNDDTALARCEWYIRETEARADDFRKRFPNIKFYEVQLEQLNNYENVVKMLDFFDLKPLDSLKGIVGQPVGTKSRFIIPENWNDPPPPDWIDPDKLENSARSKLLAECATYVLDQVRQKYSAELEALHDEAERKRKLCYKFGHSAVDNDTLIYISEICQKYKIKALFTDFEMDLVLECWNQAIQGVPEEIFVLERRDGGRYYGHFNRFLDQKIQILEK